MFDPVPCEPCLSRFHGYGVSGKTLRRSVNGNSSSLARRILISVECALQPVSLSKSSDSFFRIHCFDMGTRHCRNIRCHQPTWGLSLEISTRTRKSAKSKPVVMDISIPAGIKPVGLIVVTDRRCGSTTVRFANKCRTPLTPCSFAMSSVVRVKRSRTGLAIKYSIMSEASGEKVRFSTRCASNRTCLPLSRSPCAAGPDIIIGKHLRFLPLVIAMAIDEPFQRVHRDCSTSHDCTHTARSPTEMANCLSPNEKLFAVSILCWKNNCHHESLTDVLMSHIAEKPSNFSLCTTNGTTNWALAFVLFMLQCTLKLSLAKYGVRMRYWPCSS